MTHEEASTRDADLTEDQCHSVVVGSDNPFCYFCEDRHPAKVAKQYKLGAVLNGRIVWNV